MAKKAKSLRYWDRQFDEALPIFLAGWYAMYSMPLVEKLCEKEGVESLVKYTRGFYSAEKVGEWVVWHTHALDGIMEHLHAVDDAGPVLLEGLYDRIDFYQQPQIPAGESHKRLKRSFSRIEELGWPPKLAEALISSYGQAIQQTPWWRNNISEIRKQSRAVAAVKKIMES